MSHPRHTIRTCHHPARCVFSLDPHLRSYSSPLAKELFFIFDGILAFHSPLKSQGGAERKISRYKDPVQKSPGGSSIQVTSSLPRERLTPASCCRIWSHSRASPVPSGLRNLGNHRLSNHASTPLASGFSAVVNRDDKLYMSISILYYISL